eukprot:scaffold34292_cov69-Phaeocystis_antarctica.AAC.1
MTHGGIANLIIGMQARFGDLLPIAGKRWAVATSYSFDQWVEHIFLCLVTGGCGVQISDPTALIYLSEHDLFDAFYAVPSVYAVMQAMPRPVRHSLLAMPAFTHARAPQVIPTSANFFQVSGEALSEAALGNIGEGIVLSEYGPTETNAVTVNRATRNSSRMNSIGKPLPNVTCYVVDPSSATATSAPLLQPIGVWGE